jgi:hypothetical protein
MAQPTLVSTLRMAANVADSLDKLLNGITGLNGGIDSEIEENVRPAVRELREAIADAWKLAKGLPTVVDEGELWRIAAGSHPPLGLRAHLARLTRRLERLDQRRR